MKTTLDLPDELMLEVKIRAAHEGRRMKDVMADAVRRGLERPAQKPSAIRNRVRLPLIAGGHPAPPGEELTPERIKDILLQQDIEHSFEGS